MKYECMNSEFQPNYTESHKPVTHSENKTGGVLFWFALAAFQLLCEPKITPEVFTSGWLLNLVALKTSQWYPQTKFEVSFPLESWHWSALWFLFVSVFE